MRGDFRTWRRSLVALGVVLGGAACLLASDVAMSNVPPAGLLVSGGADRSTKGYMLTPADAVGHYTKYSEYLKDLSTRECEGAPSDADCMIGRTEVGRPVEVEEIGVREPAVARALYRYDYTDDRGRGERETVLVDGYWGTVDAPDRAIDNFFEAIEDGEQAFRGKLVGPGRRFDVKGMKGALMACQDAELQRMASINAHSGTTMRVPVCVWADYSMVAATAVVDSPQASRGARALPQPKVAALAARIYITSRTKYWHGVCTWAHCNGKPNKELED